MPRWWIGVLLLLVTGLFVTRNLPWHLDEYDQAKQAFTSYEMVNEGHWWFQHTPTGRIATKPPLAGWISAAFYGVMGGHWWQGAWRLPSLLSAAWIIALLWRHGNSLWPRNIGGFLAIAAFGLTVFTPRLASLVRTDMLLTAFIAGAGCLILSKVSSLAPWTTRERWILFGLILGSMMIKGPIAYAFLLPSLAAFWFLARRFQIKNNSWSGLSSWAVPLLFFAAWAGIGIWLSPEFYDQVVRKEFLGRFDAGEHAVHQPRNPFFYIGLILLRWQPWSLLLLLFVAAKPVRARLRQDPALLWLACWSLGGLLVMSLVPSKRFDRILPVIPPLCLLFVAMARSYSGITLSRIPIRTLILASTLCAAVLTVAYAGHSIHYAHRTDQGALVRFGTEVQARYPSQVKTLAVISGKDEGILIYTGRTAFTRLEDARRSWNSGEIDAVVVPEKYLRTDKERFAGARRVFATGEIRDKQSAYVLIEREGKSGDPATR